MLIYTHWPSEGAMSMTNDLVHAVLAMHVCSLYVYNTICMTKTCSATSLLHSPIHAVCMLACNILIHRCLVSRQMHTMHCMN
jgi:hypothetical protein